MKTIHQNDSTPKKDGYRMPGEFENHTGTWMLWPERTDNWRNGAKPAQQVFSNVAKAIAQFEPVTMCVNPDQYENAKAMLADCDTIRVVEMTSNDSWIRDCGPTFVVNGKGGVRAVDWDFNAWGGLYDGLYFPWDQDALVASKVCEIEKVVRYKPENFVLEGGSIHVDGEGTVLVTESCLLSPGRNPDLKKEQIEENLREYLNVEKIVWVKEGIDPDETNGHIDDVACYVRPGVVACIWTEDKNDPFYTIAHEAYELLSNTVDAKGRKLTVCKLDLPKNPVRITLEESKGVDVVEGTLPREEGDLCPGSYMNFLIVNGGVIVPQYGDENDALALSQIQGMFPDRKVVGVLTREVVLGGGNIHCITQQQPSGK
ncbi:agmatine deiminase [Caproiciproducens faecalis]|uniref:Putative agmatine deiminase n=1 Tax=Caproiciproducens faecalis TaxID=2820301 RepID=A0ABS7DL80_9FIRM|nr:agmatine deiminase [Caproiciproducens faecalis]MBW7571306.1 agmatine deiminase [Caproiciproducens faecalis]